MSAKLNGDGLLPASERARLLREHDRFVDLLRGHPHDAFERLVLALQEGVAA